MSFAVPNLYLKPSGFPLPTIVFVSGFSQLYPYLLMQKDVWLIGGAAHFNIVFIEKWSQISQSRIEGRLEIWRKNQQGPATFVRISLRNIVSFLDAQLTAPFQDIFPRPPLGTPPRKSLSERMICVAMRFPLAKNPVTSGGFLSSDFGIELSKPYATKVMSQHECR
jgi:hypothetical protein